MTKTPISHVLPLCLALASTISSAQTVNVPDAGAVRQQIEQQREQALPAPSRIKRSALPPPEMRPAPGVVVTVKSFRFEGNKLVDADRLAKAVEAFLNRPLGMPELQLAADAVASTYRDAGWIVRVYLPEQDVTEGTVTLQIVEALFGGVRVEGSLPTHVSAEVIRSHFLVRQGLRQPLNAEALDRALLLADDLPGVSVAGTLLPGAADGETAVALQTTDEPFLYGDVTVDNTGSRSTGSERLSVGLNINSPGQRGERVALQWLHTRGSDYGRMGLTVPVGFDGARLGFNASSMVYRVISGPTDAGSVPIQGRSSSFGLDWNYPLVRARLHNLYASAALDHKHFVTRDFQLRADYMTDSLRLGLSGNRFDDWGGGGANSASAALVLGRLTSMQAHAQIDSIQRQYTKLTYSLARQQSLAEGHTLYLALQAQHANQVLDSSERFYIGGAGSVRAYPSSEHGGDRGQLLTAEWRWRLDTDLLLTTFADLGRVVQLPQPSIPRNSLRLRGHGLSLSWAGPRGLAAQITWARRGGENPQPTLAGTDGDGTLKRDRFWVSASMPF